MKNEQTQQVNQNSGKVKTRSKSRAPSKLSLTAFTWEKQSHGLFDYQSAPQKITKEELMINESSRIFRNQRTRRTCIRQLKQQSKNIPDRIQVFNVQYHNSGRQYSLKNSLSTQLDDVMLAQAQQAQNVVERHKLFLSLQHLGNGHLLSIGDFIKLGRVQLVVLQINNGKKTQSLEFQQIYGSKQYIFHMKQNLEGSCKVCLSDEATPQDPLVNPCNCKGSCGVIHLDCLKNWINNKVKREIYGKVTTYNFEKYSCEICQAPFPSIIKLQSGEQTLLLNFERPTSPYILLEQCSQTQEKQAKTLHFILPQVGNRVMIGRGQVCQLNISDISVSRTHSYITFQKDHFYVYDDNSKFGTLVELKRDIIIESMVKLQHNGCLIILERRQEKKEKSSKSGKKGLIKTLNEQKSANKNAQ